MNGTVYTTEILRLAALLEGPSKLERIDGDADMRSPTCGSRIRVAVQLDGAGRIAKLSQEVHACAFGQASAALVERHARGRSRSEVKDALLMLTKWLANDDVAVGGWPEIEVLSPARTRKGRHDAILLPFRALLAAIESAP